MAWWLVDSIINGTLDEDYPIMSKDDDVTILGGDEDTITFTGMSSAVGAADTVSINFDGCLGSDTLNFGTPLPGGMGEDHISFSVDAGLAHTAYDEPQYYSDIHGIVAGETPFSFNGMKPKPDLDFKSQKYEEDKGIADLKDYVSSTYRGHYTNKNSDTQTLDLIHSVGDAEAFCRSNALKYLSRYDKKGSAKQDILKAMHYCLLLYYFSGNTQEPDYTNTRYETF